MSSGQLAAVLCSGDSIGRVTVGRAIDSPDGRYDCTPCIFSLPLSYAQFATPRIECLHVSAPSLNSVYDIRMYDPICLMTLQAETRLPLQYNKQAPTVQDELTTTADLNSHYSTTTNHITAHHDCAIHQPEPTTCTNLPSPLSTLPVVVNSCRRFTSESTGWLCLMLYLLAVLEPVSVGHAADVQSVYRLCAGLWTVL